MEDGMTVPIKGVDKSGGISGRKGSDRQWQWHKSVHGETRDDDEQEDSVLISDEARQRANGKLRKSILEHLAEEGWSPR